MRLFRELTLLTTTLMVLAGANEAAASRCSLEHHPVAVGDVNEYRLTSSQLDAEGQTVARSSYTYTEEVVALKNDQFRSKTTSDGETAESDWSCSEDGINVILAQFPDTKITTTGVAIPATMKVGDEWVYTIGMESGDMAQSSRTDNRVTAREKVVVPAGTFEAWRVDYVIESTVRGQKPTHVRGTQWFAPGTGIVRSVSVMEEPPGSTVETRIELMSRRSK